MAGPENSAEKQSRSVADELVSSSLTAVALPQSSPAKFAYTRRVEPIGVVGAIVPWNFPREFSRWFIPRGALIECYRHSVALAVWKPAWTCPSPQAAPSHSNSPLSVLRLCDLIKETGFPPSVASVVNANGQGPVAGKAISEHMDVNNVSFTSSPVTGRLVAWAAVESERADIEVYSTTVSPPAGLG